MMTNTAIETASRREKVSRLFLEHGSSYQIIADITGVDKSTIEDDINHHTMPALSKQYAPGRFLDAHRTFMASLEEQARRLKAQVNGPNGAKYEALYQRNMELQQSFYQKLVDSSPIEAGNERPISMLSWYEFNHLIGLPRHPHRNIPLELTPAQNKMANSIHHTLPSWIAEYKARQIGASEVVLRSLLYWSFKGKYADGIIPIIAGTSSDAAAGLFKRLGDLLKPIPQYVKSQTKDQIELTTNTTFMAMSSQPSATRSMTKASDAF